MPITFISNSGGGGYNVPPGTIIMMPNASNPAGFSRYSAIDGYYVVASPLETTIGTQGGSNTHTHLTTLASIGEASALHTHALSGNSGTASASENYYNYGYAYTLTTTNHTHNVPAGAVTGNDPAHTHSLSSSVSGAATVEPAYKTLVGYMAGANAKLPNGAIMMWYGGTPPAKFKLCDGTHSSVDMRGYFLKLSSSYSSGGSNAAHAHTMGALAEGGSHAHAVSVNLTSANTFGTNANTTNPQACSGSHGHRPEYTTSVAGGHTHPGKASVENTINPPYLAVYFIQYQE